ncbi:hypothetical protein GCM10010505_11440 [Kitasatospora aburaviensis]
MAHAVEIGGIEEGDAGVEGRADRGDGIGLVGGGGVVGHAGAAQCERGDLRAAGSKGSGLHGASCGARRVDAADRSC